MQAIRDSEMLNVFIIEENIEERNRLYEALQDALAARTPAVSMLSGVSLRPVALHELAYNRMPDICLVGRKMWSSRGCDLSLLRSAYPDVALLAVTSSPDDQLQQLDRLLYLGFDDVISLSMPTSELCTRFLVHSKKKTSTSASGRITAVVSGKGGVGATTIAVATAQRLSGGAHRAVLVDMDFETQDATRFLSARPYLNEHLTLMLEGQRPAGGECAKQCVTEPGNLDFDVVAPPAMLSQVRLEEDESIVVYQTLLRSLASTYDHVVIDVAGVTGKLAQATYQLADTILVVVSNDPAGVFATSEKVKRIRYAIGSTEKLLFAEVGTARPGLGSKQLRNYLLESLGVKQSCWLQQVVPFCRRLQLWPGTGEGAYTAASRAFRKSLDAMVHGVNLSVGASGYSSEVSQAKASKQSRQISGTDQKLLPHTNAGQHGVVTERPCQQEGRIANTLVGIRSFKRLFNQAATQ